MNANVTTSTLKAYILKQLQGYDKEIAAKAYMAIDALDAYDLAQIAHNKDAVEMIMAALGDVDDENTVTDAIATALQAAKDYTDGVVGDIGESGTVAQYVIDKIGDLKNYDDREVRGLITANADEITTLKGADTVDGSIAKKIKDAINDFATNTTDDGIKNTFAEMVNYFAENGEYTALVGDVSNNKTAIGVLNGEATEAGSVKKMIADKVGDLGESATVKAYVDSQIEDNAYDDTALAGRVTSAEGAITTLNADKNTEGSVAKAIADAIGSGTVITTDMLEDINWATEFAPVTTPEDVE